MKNRLQSSLLMGCALLLAACGGGGGTPNPGSGGGSGGGTGGGSGSTVSGPQLSGTTTGTALPDGYAFLATADATSLTNVGQFTAPDKVSVPLKERPESDLFFYAQSAGTGCTFSGTGGNPALAVLTRVDVFRKSGDLMGFVEELVTSGGAGANSLLARVYSDSALTLKGTARCADGSVTYDLSLSAGWNAAELYGSGSAVTLRTPGTVKTSLSAQAYAPGVGVALDPRRLEFGAGNAVTVDATLYQTAGYSGVIQLSTDLPGLTVEPASITLPTLGSQAARPSPLRALQRSGRALGRQNVGAQALDTRLTFRYTDPNDQTSTPFQVIARDSTGRVIGGGPGIVNAPRPSFKLRSNGRTNYDLTVGSTVDVDVLAQAVQGFTGTAELSAENLPAGMTFTPGSVTLRDTPAVQAKLTLKAGQETPPGSHDIRIVGRSGALNSSFTVRVSVPRPGVNLVIAGGFFSPYVNLYAGEGRTLPVNVFSKDGFSGSVTVGLDGLPAGVTVTPVTMTVTPQTSASLQLPVNSTATVYGAVKVRLSAPQVLSSTELTLRLLPPRLLMPGYVRGLTPGRTGLWVSAAVGGSTRSELRLYENGSLTRTVGLEEAFQRLLPQPDGSVLGDAGYYSAQMTRVTPAGTVSTVPSPLANIQDDLITADHLGRVWYGEGTHTAGQGRLMRWSPETGEIVTVDAVPGRYDFGRLWGASSPDRRTLLWIAKDTLKIDAETNAVTPLGISPTNFGKGAAISSSGQVWLISGGHLARLEASGIVTVFDTLDAGTLFGFDVARPSALWLQNGNGEIVKLDTTSLSVLQSYPVQFPAYGKYALLPGGGLAVSTDSSDSLFDSSAPTQYALLILP